MIYQWSSIWANYDLFLRISFECYGVYFCLKWLIALLVAGFPNFLFYLLTFLWNWSLKFNVLNRGKFLVLHFFLIFLFRKCVLNSVWFFLIFYNWSFFYFRLKISGFKTLFVHICFSTLVIILNNLIISSFILRC